ncbi:MAG TPA: malto-oligosyltrehalose trehalohydrolase [Steroidobacteraceae bacterium]|nr:malto-oligosyltrehalose trehalohydrolase [Steroidobacteraceae bacterium]
MSPAPTVEVWAPEAETVEVTAGGERIPMHPVAHGYWRAEVADPLLRQGYRLSVNGGEPLPDPRSRWQPQGVHGASFPASADLPAAAHAARADRLGSGAAAGAAGHATPLRDAVIYEMHIGTFTPQGTYAAARDKLTHLVELGVTHIELMPLATFPGRRGWGYDGVDLYAPFPAYGTPDELAGFVRACQVRGLSVLLDVVYNHLGPDGNYLARFGPYFTDQYRTGWGSAMNFDGPLSDGVRRFVIDNALMWLRDYGFDGLRLDAVHAIFSFGAVHVLEELACEVKRLGRELDREFVLIAESDLNDPRLVRPVQRGGLGLDAQWSDDFHHAIHAYFTRETGGYYQDFRGVADIAAALAEGVVYDGRYSVFRRRRHGRAPIGVGVDQLVVFSQNHDQIGNRAQGERLSMLLGVPALKAVAALTLLSPFVPLLFQGEEWGAKTPFLYFTDHQDAELGRLVSEGRAREFQAFRWQGDVPNPQAPETFERSRLDWSEPARAPHDELLMWYRRLIGLRRTRATGALDGGARGGRATVRFNEKAQWLWFTCGGLLVQLNLSDRAQRVPTPKGEWKLLLDSEAGAGASAARGGEHTQAMPAAATRIFARQ